MTRKHFEALADALRESGASMATVLKVADVCVTANPRFDYEKFVERAFNREG